MLCVRNNEPWRFMKKILDKRENRKIDPKSREMMELINQYIEKIGDNLITEPSTYTTEEWIEL